MYHQIRILKLSKHIFYFIIIIFLINNNAFSQKEKDHLKQIHQEYKFENDKIIISLECGRLYIFDNDSCLIRFNITNKMSNDIYIFNWKSYFSYSILKDSTLSSAIIEFGGDFDGSIDYPIQMKKIKSNHSYSEHLTFFSNKKIDSYTFSNNINIKLSFGYLEHKDIDSLNIHYPNFTSIRTKEINDDEIVTSAYSLFIYLKKIQVGSLLIDIRK